MNVGKLRHRVLIESKTTTNTGGEVTEEWSPEKAIWASVSPLAGRELEEARRAVPEATHSIATRYHAELTPQTRIKWGQRYLYVESALDKDERRIEMLSICVERV